MNEILTLLILGVALMGQTSTKLEKTVPATIPDDPYLWLEDITGDKALAWVRECNAETAKELETTPGYKSLESDILKILDSDAKIPYINKAGAYYYNFWKDARNPRGLWRRTSLDEYRKADPKWEVMLDIDGLGKTEKESWVFHGAQFFKPGYRRCLISLSRGGSDASVVREFDVETKSFVRDGFQLPQAKSQVSWVDSDTVFVGTDFGAGSLTSSGYPRVAKVWKRGTPLSEARTIFEVKEADMICSAFHDPTKGFERDFLVRVPSFFTSETFLLGKEGSKRKVEVPDDSESSVHREWLLVKLRTPWTVGGKTYTEGSLLAARFDEFMAGKRELVVLFEPTATVSLADFSWTRDYLILNVLDDVKNRLYVLTPTPGQWKQESFQGAPAIGTVSASGVDPDESNDYFMDVADFLTPSTLYHGTIGGAREMLKKTPAFFDASGLEVSQHFTNSQDAHVFLTFRFLPRA